uniref:hypothetical protein n=1 Tax=Sphingomonas sp. AR_OL41 TaxID=3042729 RepID=UPI0024818E10|nr:hypothetical protein [Sphingomonas sp. AR_OL41]
MSASHVDLQRRFRPATDEEGRQFDGLFDRSVTRDPGWPGLLEKRRVVVLAEAGSGKSAEFERTCATIRATGAFAFATTVRDVAMSGLPAAFVPADRRRFDSWKADGAAPCWLFVDSVDEAKDQGHHFDTAVRHLADAIVGHEERVHLYISGRFTDWDKTADSEAMVKWLSLPEPPPPLPPNFGEEVRATLHRKDRDDKPAVAEAIEVLLMEPLTRSQVRRFADGSGVADADALLQAIDDGDLWQFAVRPLDLGWIVEYWRDQRRLGTLREMIEASIRVRLIDPDVRRRRADPLDVETAGKALNRIGAAFLLCGKDTVRVPAAGLDMTPPEKSVPLDAILPEWPDAHRLRLLGRPVFDPATLGRARLHSDNKGTLRCYLTARWHARMLDAGCPLQTVHDLLFVDLYGYRLVRPDMVESAAWLAGTNTAIAEELISRDPFALLRHGDPGSLPMTTRFKAFTAALAQVDDIDHEKLWFADEGLRRFAAPELDAHFADWWAQAGDSVEAQHLVLRLIWVGRQQGGLPIVGAVAFDPTADELTQLLAGRALTRIGNLDDLRRYARHVVDNSSALTRSVVMDGLEALFPQYISVAEFVTLIDQVGVKDDGGHVSVLPLDAEIVDGFQTAADLQAFLEGLLARFGELTGDHQEHPFRDAFAKIAAIGATRLLDHFPDAIPDVVTDLNLLLRESERFSGDDAARSLGKHFSTSPGRRRTSFWRTVERLRTHPFVPDPDDINIWSIQYFGWPVMIEDADLEWLIADIVGRADARERLTALRTAHSWWRQSGQRPEVLKRLVGAAADDAALAEQLGAWLLPQEDPPVIRQQMADLEALRKRNDEQGAARDDSWVNLIATLRDDPTVFDRLSAQTAETVDTRLFHLWQFLTWRTQSRDRYAIDNLDAVRPIFGEELTRRFGDALIAFADAHQPVGPVEETAERRSVSNFDIMAMTGTALAAGTVQGWASRIGADRALQAARLAIVELNGFPDYLTLLAEAYPAVVHEVLLKAVNAQLSRTDPAGHGMLDRLEYADPAFGRLIVADLVEHLRDHPDLQVVSLEKIVSALLHALPIKVPGLADLASERAQTSADPVAAAYYLLLLFALEGNTAVDALRAKMETLDGRGQADLCCVLLPRLFGGRLNRAVRPPKSLSVKRLEQLLIIAFEGVKPSEDTVRADLVVYSPELRDDAQDARNMIFDLLRNTPGEATHAALLRLSDVPDFPIEPRHLRIWTRRHAEADAVLVEWQPADVKTFEQSFDRAPTTTADLQLVARRRLERIQHDLIDGKYAQGDTLQGLVDEGAVQRWMGIQLEAMKGEAYTVQRETHYAGEKEPDIALTSRHSGVELPIEIKIVDGLTVAQMEAALETQLCGQYLRHASTRHGILLLVYQNARSEGWRLIPDRPPVPFADVLEHLHGVARGIREDSCTGPQPIVASIDVSDVVSLQRRRAAARTAKKT